jgi:cytochrome c5
MRTAHRTAARAATLALAAALAACGGGETPAPQPPGAAAAPGAAPADPRLARLYNRSCKTCHGAPGTGAPLSGDARAWEARLAQGMPVLLERTLSGYKGMPPLGSCAECTEKEFEALIRFMAAPAASAPPA